MFSLYRFFEKESRIRFSSAISISFPSPVLQESNHIIIMLAAQIVVTHGSGDAGDVYDDDYRIEVVL